MSESEETSEELWRQERSIVEEKRAAATMTAAAGGTGIRPTS